jgi:hypothetical protein
MRERTNGADLLAPLQVLDGVGRQRCRQLEMDLVTAGAGYNWEPGVAKDAEHPKVCREHDRDELMDPVGRGVLDQLAEQQRAESTSLVLVGDGKRDLGALGIDPRIQRMPDNSFIGTGCGDEPKRLHVVDVTVMSGKLREIDSG